MIAVQKVPVGTIRVKTKDLLFYEKTAIGWKKSTKTFPELLEVARTYRIHHRFNDLIDPKNPEFLKGEVSPDGQERGARINILPSGEKLEKAFSLFSPHLILHDQTSHDHWDVLYQNKGGTWSYVYTQKKRRQRMAQKYRKVEVFSRCYAQLLRKATKALQNEHNDVALAFYTLIKTNMRVGNELYFKANGHKGLTTLMKKDVSIKEDVVNFRYIGKDGVPTNISQRFPLIYIRRLENTLRTKKRTDFLFDTQGRLLHENDFKRAFYNYCGHEFYPHIVRSYYATNAVKSFLAKHRTFTKQQLRELYFSIAHALGHMSFDKKKGEWHDSYAVTIHSYVQPELIHKVERIVKEK